MSEGNRFGTSPQTMGGALGTAVQKEGKKKKRNEKDYDRKQEFVERQERKFKENFSSENFRLRKIKRKELQTIVTDLPLMIKEEKKGTGNIKVVGFDTFALDRLHKSLPKKEKKEFEELKNFFQKNKNKLLELVGMKLKEELPSVLNEEDKKKFDKEEKETFFAELPAKLKELRDYYYKYAVQDRLQQRKEKINNEELMASYSDLLPILSLRKQNRLFAIIDKSFKNQIEANLIGFREVLFADFSKSKELLGTFNEKESRSLSSLLKDLMEETKDHSKKVAYENLVSLLSRNKKSEKKKPKVKKVKEVKVVKENIQKPVQEKKGQKKKEKSLKDKLADRYKRSANNLNKKINVQDKEAESLGLEFSFNKSKAYLTDKLDRVESNLKNEEKKLAEERKERLTLRKEYIKKRNLFLKHMKKNPVARENYFERKAGRVEAPTIDAVLKMQRKEKGRTNLDDLGLLELEQEVSGNAFSIENEYITDSLTDNYFELVKSLGKNDLDKGRKMLADLILQRNIFLVNIPEAEKRIEKELENKKGNYKDEIKRYKNSILRMKKELSKRNLHLRNLIDLVK